MHVLDIAIITEDGGTFSMANAQRQQEHDPIGSWLKEANEDFFGSVASIDAATRSKALIGFIVWAIGLAIIITQVL